MSESVGATAEQMRASAHVVERTERVQAGVVGIRAATHGQERSNDEVRKGSDALRAVAQRVRETIASQALGAARIGESIETVQRTVREITGGLREQGDACERAAQVVGLSKEHIHANEESAESLGSAARELEHEAEALRDAVRRFRI